MELHLTLTSAPPSAFPRREIVVDTDVVGTGAALAVQLEIAGYSRPFTVDGVPLASLLPHSSDLHNGTVIVAGEHQRRDGHPRIPHLAFVVHSGPDAGQVFALSRGSYTVGRAACDITVADPALSRHHARLTVAEDAILLEDLGSENGTFVDGESITRAPITVTAAVRLGSSHCRIELLDDQSWRPAIPRELLEPLPIGADLPRKPSRFLILTALLPLVLGVVLALTTGMWFFLAFSALSAVTGLVPLLTYLRAARTFTTAVDSAAERDRVRRQHGVPDPGRTALDALSASRAGPQPAPGVSPPEVVLLRIGAADQSANLSVGRHEGSFIPPTLSGLPLVFACRAPADGCSEPGFTIAGEPDGVRSLVRALLLQLAHPQATAPPVVCWGSAREVPLQARYLPNVYLTKNPAVLSTLLGQAALCLVFQFADDLPDIHGRAGAYIIRVLTGGGNSGENGLRKATTAGSGVVIRAGGAAWARIDGCEFDVVADGVSAPTFDRTARALARAAADKPGRPSTARGAGAEGRGTVPPPSASLWSTDLTPSTVSGAAGARWPFSDPDHPTAYVGESGTGPISIDLVTDGPHLLVAGTTGSGKSEFLRTLVLGLALNQPPEHLALLLIDYKGGSGLGALAPLPHCVGSLSDLSSESTARALVSLRAELRRRERLCADHGAPDLAGLRRVARSACPPRLVVVIDEFRMLSDEVPTAVPDLMKIAALGRSLGVHLVLATQRPQGAVAPDLRANITSSVLLRVQTPMESQDLLGSAAAAEIPVDAPGRAFLRRGAEAPVAFQVASCSAMPSARGSMGWQDIAVYLGDDAPTAPGGCPGATPAPLPLCAPSRPRTGAAGGTPVRSASPSASATQDTTGHGPAGGATTEGQGSPGILHSAAAALSVAAGGSGGYRPPRPVLPPLAAVLRPGAWSDLLPADPGTSYPPALLPAPSGAVALGIADFPEHQEQRLLQWRPRDHSHLAFIGLPGCGARAALTAAVSALPVVDPDVHLYLLDGDGSLADVSRDLHVGAYVQPHETKRAGRVIERLVALTAGATGGGPQIVLAIAGWGRWTSRFRDGRSSRAEEDLHALIREGARSGVSIVITGDRELTTARFFPLVPNRIYLPLGAHPETTMTWPRMPVLDAIAGRGLVQGFITGSWGEGVCQLVLEPTAGTPARPPGRAPFPVHPLPPSVPLAQLAPADGERSAHALAVGVYGDDLRPYRITLRPGEAYLVLGHPASGRSNALRVLAEAAGLSLPEWKILTAPDGAGSSGTAEYWRRLAERGGGPGPTDRRVLIVDDADHLPADVQQILSGLVARGAAAVLSAVPGPALMTRVPLSLQARVSGRGFVLSPRSPGEGEVFGARLDVDAASIPGRGYACEPAGTLEVQLARASGDHIAE